jgi:hypothetical protein
VIEVPQTRLKGRVFSTSGTVAGYRIVCDYVTVDFQLRYTKEILYSFPRFSPWALL